MKNYFDKNDAKKALHWDGTDESYQEIVGILSGSYNIRKDPATQLLYIGRNKIASIGDYIVIESVFSVNIYSREHFNEKFLALSV